MVMLNNTAGLQDELKRRAGLGEEFLLLWCWLAVQDGVTVRVAPESIDDHLVLQLEVQEGLHSVPWPEQLHRLKKKKKKFFSYICDSF